MISFYPNCLPPLQVLSTYTTIQVRCHSYCRLCQILTHNSTTILQKNKKLYVYGSGSPMTLVPSLSCVAANLSFNGVAVQEKSLKGAATPSHALDKNGFAPPLGCNCALHPSTNRKTTTIFISPFSFLHLVWLPIPPMVRLCFFSSLNAFSPPSFLLGCPYFHFLWCLFFPFSNYPIPFLLNHSHSCSLFLFW